MKYLFLLVLFFPFLCFSDDSLEIKSDADAYRVCAGHVLERELPNQLNEILVPVAIQRCAFLRMMMAHIFLVQLMVWNIKNMILIIMVEMIIL